jgi:hypothetical protein
MKVLLLHSNQQSYIVESVFLGLRKLLGTSCVDVPRYDSMYAPITEGIKAKLRGNGFTLYGLLEDIPELVEKRFFWRKDINSYDIILIGGIWHREQWDLLWELSLIVEPKKLAIIDHSDHPAFFPFASMKWRLRNYPWSYLFPISKFKYFKRELVGEGASYGLDRFFPRYLRKWIPIPKNAVPISYSIPEEKIWKVDISRKTKDFATHIVDPEVAARFDESFFSSTGSEKYIFTSEKDYYDDLRKSRFCITTKRGGWECLRHYEIAANGCVPCFRDLDKKPQTCAPHGLNESNCIIYHSYDELIAKINALDEKKYEQLQANALSWVRQNTTVERAKQLLIALNLRE